VAFGLQIESPLVWFSVNWTIRPSWYATPHRVRNQVPGAHPCMRVRPAGGQNSPRLLSRRRWDSLISAITSFLPASFLRKAAALVQSQRGAKVRSVGLGSGGWSEKIALGELGFEGAQGAKV
jgi:hypothetical protein